MPPRRRPSAAASQGSDPSCPEDTHRYTATSYGLKVAFFYAKLYLRILRPSWAALLPDNDLLPPPIRAALDQLDLEIRKLHEEAALAA